MWEPAAAERCWERKIESLDCREGCGGFDFGGRVLDDTLIVD